MEKKPKHNALINSNLYRFSGRHPQKDDKYFGDTYLHYEDIIDSFTDDARFRVFGGQSTRNYISLKHSKYEWFGKMIGNIILQSKMQEDITNMQNSKEFQAAMKANFESQVKQQKPTKGKLPYV